MAHCFRPFTFEYYAAWLRVMHLQAGPKAATAAACLF